VSNLGFGGRRKFFGCNWLQENQEFRFAGTPVNNCQDGQFGRQKSFGDKDLRNTFPPEKWVWFLAENLGLTGLAETRRGLLDAPRLSQVII
jgi:hypothetical protein